MKSESLLVSPRSDIHKMILQLRVIVISDKGSPRNSSKHFKHLEIRKVFHETLPDFRLSLETDSQAKRWAESTHDVRNCSIMQRELSNLSLRKINLPQYNFKQRIRFQDR